MAGPLLFDRVWDLSTTTGTGSFALANSPVTGHRSFGGAGMGNGDTAYYMARNRANGEWEVGLGTYSTTGPALARTVVLASSTGSAVNFTAGTKDVQLVIPSSVLAPLLNPNSLAHAVTGLGVTVNDGALEVTGELPTWLGIAPGTGVATFLGTPSSENLRGCLTDETGTGAAVFANTPTLITPVLGAATGTSVICSATVAAGSVGLSYANTSANAAASARINLYNDAGQTDGTHGFTIVLNSSTAGNSNKLFLFNRLSGAMSLGTNNVERVLLSAAGKATFLAASILAIARNTAPADADLSAGECSLWFDSTNGAAKLMIKGKSANGTVVTGQVALS